MRARHRLEPEEPSPCRHSNHTDHHQPYEDPESQEHVPHRGDHQPPGELTLNPFTPYSPKNRSLILVRGDSTDSPSTAHTSTLTHHHHPYHVTPHHNPTSCEYVHFNRLIVIYCFMIEFRILLKYLYFILSKMSESTEFIVAGVVLLPIILLTLLLIDCLYIHEVRPSKLLIL